MGRLVNPLPVKVNEDRKGRDGEEIALGYGVNGVATIWD